MPKFRHVIVDRDGVLNREPASGWVLDPGDWVWEKGALEGLQALVRARIEVSVATNQSCIGRGLASPEAVDAVNRRMISESAAAGAEIARVLVCPHTDQDRCSCRKPRPGLLLRATEESGVAAEDTLFVGDALRDLDAGRAAGLAVALVRTGKGRRAEAEIAGPPLAAFDDLLAAARWIVGSG